jgi:hypothetical protein
VEVVKQLEKPTTHPQKWNVLKSLLEGASLREAGDAHGVSHDTVRRWAKQDSEFATALNVWGRLAVRGVIVDIVDVSSKAVATLREIMEDVGVEPKDRIAAAKQLLVMFETIALVKIGAEKTPDADDLPVGADDLPALEAELKRRRDGS